MKRKFTKYPSKVVASSSKKIVASKMSDIDLLMQEALECTTKDELGAVISGLDSLGLRKLYLHYMEMLRDDSLSVGYIASELSDELYNKFKDIESCDKVTASSNSHPKIPDGWERVSEGDDEDGNWTTISKELPNNDGYCWIDLYENDNGKKYYEIQVGYRKSDGSIGDTSSWSSKQFYRLGDAVKFAEDKISRLYTEDVDASSKIESRTLDKWNHNTKEYEPVEIPDDWNVKMYSEDMDEIINCPNCGKEFPYGEGYTSRRYHNKYGMGYMECEDCYYEQLNDEFGDKDVNACDKVEASEICYRDKDNDDRVVALDVGMSDEDVEEMLAAHPSYYRSTLDRFDDINGCDNVIASSGIFYTDQGAGIGSRNQVFTEDDLRAAFNSLLSEGDPVATSYDSFETWRDATLDSGLLGVEFLEEDVENPDVEFDETDIDATTKPQYFANMVNASRESMLFTSNCKYYVGGYADGNKRVLISDFDTDDFDGVIEGAHDMARRGLYVVIKNQETGDEIEYGPDTWLESIDLGGVPEDIYSVM